MTTEQKWRIVWAVWVGSFVAVETIAVMSKLPEAPLSHHLRTSTHRAGQTRTGRIALWLTAELLHRHLYAKGKTHHGDWPR